MTEYVPGVCNIGRAEKRRRAAVGVVGSLVTLALFLWVLTADVSPFYLLLTAFPLFLFAEGFLQAGSRFCTGFASAGIYDVSAEGGERHEVTDPEQRAADQRRARQLHLQAATVALGGTALLVGLGLLVG